MVTLLRRFMDGVYRFCVVIAGSAMVLISFIVPWGVFTRYGLNSASSWPEPAACYRVGLHMRVSFVRDHLPPLLQRGADILSELLMAAVGLFMMNWGYGLCQTTWNQSIAEFPSLSVGLTYVPIPLGGLCLLLFVIERLLIGPPIDTTGDAHATAAFE